ncbi:MAG: hypothetical protein JO182_31505, partial [Acidobacteriaceae bacterium]|nr:hypothetical protein [Acidobacteriaceae bacterium]
MRPLRYLSTVCRIGVPLFLVLGSAVSQAWAQSTMPTGATSCLSIPPSFVPFSSIYYVSAPNANGDYLVVGNMSLEKFSVLWSGQIPLPDTPNQQVCSPFQIAPGLYAQAYVPTMAERQGNFSDFQGPFPDPFTYNPSTGYYGALFPGGIIPSSILPATFAWRIHTLVPPPALHFMPVTPCRVADTRKTVGPFGGPLLSGQTTRDFAIPESDCSIPANAQAYSLNFTVVPVNKLSYITVFPTGQQQPLASTLNSYDGRIKANAAIVPAGTNGAVSVFTT